MAPLTAVTSRMSAAPRTGTWRWTTSRLALAATLIEWKAQRLAAFLKKDEKDEPDAVRDEVVRLLQAHRQELAVELAERQHRASRRHSHPERWDAYRRPACTEPSDEEEPGTVSVWDLEQQARQLASEVEEERAKLAAMRRYALTITADPDPVAEMADWLCQRLRDGGPIDALPLGSPSNQLPPAGVLFSSLHSNAPGCSKFPWNSLSHSVRCT